MIRFLSLSIAMLAVAGAPTIVADIGPSPISSDFDAEFARAADLLESGRRGEAETILAEIRTRSAQPAWQARADLLLASDDERRKDFAAAARRLESSPAAAIGLEPYRRLRLGRALAAAGDPASAEREYRAAIDSDEPFAFRARAARDLAALLERAGRPADASRVLAAAADIVGPDATATAVERIRVGLALRDAASVATVARELVLAGVDGASLPAFARAPFREQLARLQPADRARVGRLLVSAGDAASAVRILSAREAPLWPAPDRSATLLALARAQARLGDSSAAERTAALIPQDETAASFETRLFRADLAIARAVRKRGALAAGDPALTALERALLPLTQPPSPLSVRAAARERLIRVDCEAERFDDALELARSLTAESPRTTAGFEPLWRLSWDDYRKGDFAGARRRFEKLSSVYREPARERRLTYWRARCLEREQRGPEAEPLYRSLAAADPADLYALFARRHTRGSPTHGPEPATETATASAAYRRCDELLRLRFFEEASAEARALPSSAGRDRRLAEAEFALGHFAAAAAAAKRAFPEIATAEEGRVPDAWRRLFYPIEPGGFLAARAREFGVDPAILRGLVRQESVFDPDAKSRAGALGLTQLLPSTARSLSRSVLRVRYRRAFLYDPRSNARLGAAYLRQLADRFGGSPIFALAAYNGGPTRMARVLRENPGLEEDELFESHPAYETRDYVRHVLLYAESYRELYPEAKSSAGPLDFPSPPRAGERVRMRGTPAS